MRVAIIHFWLVAMRGGERVLENICDLFPHADVFTHAVNRHALSAKLRGRNIKTTFIQNLPFSCRSPQMYLPLMPRALEQLDLQDYDLIISSEAGPAKGVIGRPDAAHVCYCHSPMRYIWDQYHIYKNNAGMLTRLVMPRIAHQLRQWDVSSASRVDTFVANSAFVAQRIEKYYRRDALVIYPPVNVELFSVSNEVDSSFLWVGQLVPYKRCDVAVSAFNKLGLPLTVVGTGPEKARLQLLAKSNIRFIDKLSFDSLVRTYSRARAVVFTATEDFGMVPVEAMASGRPVIAFGRGGVLESVSNNVTGIFYSDSTTESLIDAVERFERWLPHFDPQLAVASASRFAPERFAREFGAVVDDAIAAVGQTRAKHLLSKTLSRSDVNGPLPVRVVPEPALAP